MTLNQEEQSYLKEFYPMHAKLHALDNKNQICGEFLDWLQSSGRQICTIHEHTDNCYDEPRDGYDYTICGYSAGEYMPIHISIDKLLAEYFGIDLKVLEQEKQQMLETLRNANKNK